jgi:hypothetical protein
MYYTVHITSDAHEGGTHMTPKEMVDRINQLLDQASMRQLELILEVIQVVLK